MAVISLNKKYKLSFLHPQMSSIWAEYALHVPPDALVYFCSLETTACEKVVTEQNRGINLLLTPLFIKP